MPLALSVPRFVFGSFACAAFCPSIAEFPARPLVNTAACILMDSFVNGCPVLLDGFTGWVVLHEARSQRFAWALTVSHLPLLNNFGLHARVFLRF